MFEVQLANGKVFETDDPVKLAAWYARNRLTQVSPEETEDEQERILSTRMKKMNRVREKDSQAQKLAESKRVKQTNEERPNSDRKTSVRKERSDKKEFSS